MEPIEDSGRVIYVIHTTVAYFDTNGWIRFEGSQERMHIGTDCTLRIGDKVKITIEKDNTNAVVIGP